MPIVDEEGKILGQVNIVDAVVVMLVVALVAAGMALVTSAGGSNTSSQSQTEYALVTFQPQPDSISTLVDPGQNVTVVGGESSEKLNVLDVYRTPVGSDTSRVTALVSVTGDASEQALKAGVRQQFSSARYQLNGTITGTYRDRPNLTVRRTNVTLKTNLSQAVRETVDVGDEYRIGNETVARIEEMVTIPATRTSFETYVRVSLDARADSDRLQFGGKTLRLGNNLMFRTDQYEFAGAITGVNSSSLALRQSETAVQLDARVPVSVAQSVTPGDEYRTAGRSIATIESVSVFPTNSSSRKLVRVGARLQTTTRGGTSQFLNQTVTTGGRLEVPTDEYTLNGTVSRLGDSSVENPQATRTATVLVRDVPPVIADAYTAGAVERYRNTTYARVLSKQTSPATVVLRTDSGEIYEREHPTDRNVQLTVELHGNEEGSGFQFHGRRLQTGNRIVLDLGTVTARGTVTAVADE